MATESHMEGLHGPIYSMEAMPCLVHSIYQEIWNHSESDRPFISLGNHVDIGGETTTYINK